MADSDQQLKSDALLEQMKTHLTTDAGKETIKKVGLVYQLNIAPKVKIFMIFMIFSYGFPSFLKLVEFGSVFWCGVSLNWQKLGFNEVIYTVDLKKGEVKKG